MKVPRCVSVYLLLIALLFSLCSCGGSGTVVEVPEKKVLRIMHYQKEAKQAYINMFDRFMEENPDIVIEYDLTGGDEYRSLLRKRFLANEPIDIVGVHPGVTEAVPYAQSGYLLDLTGRSFLNGIQEEALETGLYEGRYYGLPVDQSYIACLYNQDMFDQYGLAIPKTWREFLTVCDRLSREGVTPVALGHKGVWAVQLIPYALAVTAVYRANPLFDEKMYRGETNFSGSEWRSVFEMCRDLIPYVNQNFMDITFEQALSMFASQKTAMIVSGTFSLNLLYKEEPRFKFGAFILPASGDGENWTPYAVGGMLSISAGTENQEAALRFFDYFMRDDIYYQYLSDSLNLPVKKGVSVEYNPILRQLFTNVSQTHVFVNQNWPQEMTNFFILGVQEMFAGRDNDTVLRELDSSWARMTGLDNTEYGGEN